MTLDPGRRSRRQRRCGEHVTDHDDQRQPGEEHDPKSHATKPTGPRPSPKATGASSKHPAPSPSGRAPTLPSHAFVERTLRYARQQGTRFVHPANFATDAARVVKATPLAESHLAPLGLPAARVRPLLHRRPRRWHPRGSVNMVPANVWRPKQAGRELNVFTVRKSRRAVLRERDRFDIHCTPHRTCLSDRGGTCALACTAPAWRPASRSRRYSTVYTIFASIPKRPDPASSAASSDHSTHSRSASHPESESGSAHITSAPRRRGPRHNRRSVPCERRPVHGVMSIVRTRRAPNRECVQQEDARRESLRMSPALVVAVVAASVCALRRPFPGPLTDHEPGERKESAGTAEFIA